MDVKQFRAEEKSILDRYRQKLGKAISYDGVVDPDLYFSDQVTPKLLFVLQMPNWDKREQEEDWSLVEHLRNEKSQWQTWGTLAKWIYTVYSHFGVINEPHTGSFNNEEDMKKYLLYSAFLNINKCGGPLGKNQSTILNAATTCSDELFDQILLYKSDLIIGGNVGYALKQVLKTIIDEKEKKKTDTDFWYYNVNTPSFSAYFLDFFHPAIRGMGQDVTAHLFLNSIKEITGNK